MKSFKNKKVWIIGASVGIGAALAEELAKEGAMIALSARDEAKLNQLKTNLTGQGHLIFLLDITDSEKTKQAANEIASNFGNIDSVIFMAATYQPHSNAGYTDINMAKHIMDVNFNGAMNVTHAVLPILNAQGNSQLVYCASVAGYRGLPAGQPYCASKAALINYAESVAIEQKNIDIKIISPGFVKTRLTDKNSFKMPFLITPDEAAKRIVKGLKSSCFEIHFPKRFTYIMKLLRILPYCVFIRLAKRVKV